jgi:hypothetical protein
LINILLLISGIPVLLFGLWLYYRQPLWFFCLVGLIAGFLTVCQLNLKRVSEAGWIELAGGVLVAVVFGGLSFVAKQYLQPICGYILSIGVGVSLGYTINEGIVILLVMVFLCFWLFLLLYGLYFSKMFILASAYIGSSAMIDGIFGLFPQFRWLDRANLSLGEETFLIIILGLLATIGSIIQFWIYHNKQLVYFGVGNAKE